MKPSIDQFIDGMDSIEKLFSNYVKKCPHVFLPLFVNVSEPLTVNQFRGVYAVVWSEEGSNRRIAEEDSVYCFDQLLIKVQYL